jgi:hypothetical protein
MASFGNYTSFTEFLKKIAEIYRESTRQIIDLSILDCDTFLELCRAYYDTYMTPRRLSEIYSEYLTNNITTSTQLSSIALSKFTELARNLNQPKND